MQRSSAPAPGGSPVMGGAGAAAAPPILEPFEEPGVIAPVAVAPPFVPPFVPPNEHPEIEGEHSYAVVPVRLDMQPGDFRFITMRESCRSIYKSVYLAIDRDDWAILAGIDLPDEYTPDDRLSINEREERNRFYEVYGRVYPKLHLGGYGERGLAMSAMKEMLTIARLGWRGYLERRMR